MITEATHFSIRGQNFSYIFCTMHCVITTNLNYETVPRVPLHISFQNANSEQNDNCLEYNEKEKRKSMHFNNFYFIRT